MTNPKNKLNILIGLDLSEMDEALIKYILLLSKLLPIGQLTFLHNIKKLELPESFKSPEKLKIIADTITKKLEKAIPSLLQNDFSYTIEVTHADYTELSFTKIAKQFNIDLALLGNKQNLEGNGGLGHKLIRVLPFPTLLVPETFNPAPSKFIEAVDFSRFTNKVVQWGNRIQEFSSLPALNFQPVYISKVSLQFFPGPSPAEIAENTQLELKKKSAKWQKLFPQAVPLKIIAAQQKNIAATLMDYVKQQKTDMVIMGVQGVTSLTTLFMGSVANELVHLETDSCLLLVKQKIMS